MPEQVQKILDKVLDWWKKFNVKQKAMLISSTAVVIVALIILAVVVSQPKYVPLVTCESTKDAAKVKSILDGDSSIKYILSDDGLSFKVRTQDEGPASILLGDNDIPAAPYSIDNVVNGSFSQTEADKQKKYQVYLEEKFAEHLASFDNIEEATVDITMPQNDGTILSREEKSTAAVKLVLKGEMSDDQAYGIAQWVATVLGNDTTDGITILDQDAHVIYSGSDSNSSIGTASTQLSYTQKQENMIKQEIKDVLAGTKLYSNIEVAMNLNMNFDSTETATHEYSYPDGQSSGAVSSRDDYESEAVNGNAAVPGTDSNDNNTYVMQDGDNTSSTITESSIKYQNNEKVTTTKNNGGTINYDSSSVSIVATKHVIYDEEKMRASGQLDNMTFDEFVAQNSQSVPVEVDESLYAMIANATGFPQNSITILCYQQPEFNYAPKNTRNLTDYLQIALTVLIFALLGYVVFRSTRSQKAEEAAIQQELSVEDLLESTAEAQEELEDIGYSEKSETRILIEKFVDENPEAVALLLRNWLNEEWD